MKVNERSIWVRDISVSTYNETLPESPTTVTIPDENSEYFNISNGRAKEISRSMNFYKTALIFARTSGLSGTKIFGLAMVTIPTPMLLKCATKPMDREIVAKIYKTILQTLAQQKMSSSKSITLPNCPHFSLLTIIESSGYAKI